MNKLVFIYLLLCIILNIQSTEVDCTSITPSTGGGQTGGQTEGGEGGEGGRRLDNNPCQGAKQVTGYNCVADNNRCVLKSLCELETDSSKCEKHTELTDKKCVKDGTNCKLVSTSTNSSNILNIFKITFILLFIFTIL